MFNITRNFNFLKTLSNVRFHSANRIKQHKIVNKYITVAKKIESVGQKIESKGFLRSFKPYAPAVDINDKVLELCDYLNIPTDQNRKLDSKQKFDLLNECFQKFNHSVPNSTLYEIKTLGDVLEFYNTPVDTTLPMDRLAADVPKNLHLIQEPLRFHPDEDMMFGGQSAFPKSSTLVTGLKYRNKYKGHIAKRSWP